MRSRPLAVLRARVVVLVLCLTAFILAPSRPLSGQATSAAPTAVAPAGTPHTDTLLAPVGRGARLHYVERGTGPAVILVHGTFGDLGDWEQQIAAAFAPRYRVVAYSRRFHPPNTPPAAADRYIMDEQAEDLAALIRYLHAAPAHLVAHSYGAYVALRLALLHPELVRSLVLAEPPVLGFLNGTPEADSVGAAFRASALEPSRGAFARGDSVDGLRRFLDGVIGRPGAFDAMPEGVRAARLPFASELRAEMLTPDSLYMTPVSCEQVRQLRRPVLLFRGEKSARMFHLIAARLQGCLTASDTATVPGASHGSQVYSPIFSTRVLEFLAAH